MRFLTFYHRALNDRRPVKSRVSAYTTMAAVEWEGCICYEIPDSDTRTAKEARKMAIERRLAHEIAEWEKRKEEKS